MLNSISLVNILSNNFGFLSGAVITDRSASCSFAYLLDANPSLP